jgi:two-component system phosphate regulon sensor histidine kinase PhoR
MSDFAPAFRAFAVVFALGLTVVFGLWICVRIAAQNSRPAAAPVETLSSDGPPTLPGTDNASSVAPAPSDSRLADPLDADPDRERVAGTAVDSTLRSESTRARMAAARAAGDVVLVFGVLGAIVVAAVFAVQRVRRNREIDTATERIGWIGDPATNTATLLPVDRSVAMDRLFRGLVDSHERLRDQISRLDAERKRAFHVLAHMTDGVVAVSPDRHVLLLNPAARNLLGVMRQSLLGRRLAEVIRVPQIIDLVDAVLAGRGPDEIEFDLASDNDRSLRVQAIELPGDRAPGVLVTIHDATQLKHLERMRREFIANVSHELKTPLAAVKGYAETLQLGAKDDPETCTHFLNQIDFQTLRLERLINDMLQLARAQTGSENLRLMPVPLIPVVRESLLTYQPLALARQINVSWEPPPNQVSVVADREALLTIVNNLLGNAVRYTPEGGEVEIRVRSAGAFWAIIVTDNGIGIPEEDQQRIFERFYRVEKARDATRGGTGLGLSIVKNLVSALSGEIRLKSRLGRGSTFEVLLPAASPNTSGSQQNLT